MEELAFDNGIIGSHPIYSQCGSTLDAVSKKDYPNEDFFDKGIRCLDMDVYETQTCHGNKSHTMDAAIGIKSYSNNKFHAIRLLLVELRMDYKSEKNLSKTALENKVSHTKALLGNGSPINAGSFFIFRPGVIQRVKRWFNDMSNEGGIIKQCEPLSTDDFNGLIKPESAFPYTPVTNIPEMERSLRQLLVAGNFTAFISQTEYWLKTAFKFHLQYNNNEYCCIMQPVINIWHDFRASSPVLSDEDSLDADILEEDYNALLQPVADVG